MKRHLSLVGAALGSFALFAGSAVNAECGKVSVGAMGWASGETITAVATFLMENGYGCEVEVVPTDTIPAVTSLAENNEPDVVPEVWKNSAPVYAQLEADGKVVTAASVFEDGGVEGWWIPKYLADAHPELTTIDGILANPGLIDNRFHNCPVGWGCRVVSDNLAQVFDFEGNGIEKFDHGSGANLAASIASAYEDEAPWFGYYWGPTAVLGKYPMTKVSLGDVVPEIHACNQKEDCGSPGISDFPAAPVLTAVTSTFAEENPDLAALTGKMVFPNQVLNEILAWKEDNAASADEAAAYFLSNYKDLWKSWLNDTAREKLSGV